MPFFSLTSTSDIAASATLRHFWPMLEQSGTTISDVKGGLVWDVSISGTTGEGTSGVYGPHSLEFDATERSIMTTLTNVAGAGENPIPLTSGTFATFDSSKVQLALAVGYPDPTYTPYVRCALGDSNGLIYDARQGIGLAGAPLHTAWFDGTENLGQTRYTLPLINHPADPGNGDVADPALFETATQTDVPCVQFSLASQSNDIQRYEVRNASTWALLEDSNGETLKTNYAVSTDTLDPAYDGYTWASGLTPNPCLRFAGMRMVGYAIFEYDTLPAGWEEMVRWTAAEWLAGRRHIHPGLL